jgi:iron complex outermembrane receptor protein
VEPEYIDAVEVGTKLNAFGGRLQLSAAWFQYWYTDLQVFDIVNDDETVPTQQLLNSDADVMGVELELQVHPLSGLFPEYDWLTDGFFVQFGGGWLDSEFLDFSVTKVRLIGGVGSGGIFRDTYDYTGNPLIAAPEWNFSGLVEWEIPISRWGSIVPSYNFSYRSRIALDPSSDELISQPGYWLHNARLAYRTPGGRIEVAGWVRNITDEQYVIDVFDLTLQFQTFLQVWGDPRMYGLNVSYLW